MSIISSRCNEIVRWLAGLCRQGRRRRVLMVGLPVIALTTASTGIHQHMQCIASQTRQQSQEERDLKRADEYAKLGNWDAAGPIYRDLERRFEAIGDSRNARYVRISWLRTEEEYTDLHQLSLYLENLLRSPDVQKDLRTKMRCLEVKGSIDLNADGLSARQSFEELIQVARRLNDQDAESRASGELGIIAFLEGNTSEARWRVLDAIAKAFLRGDEGAQIRYLALMGQGLVEHQWAEEALLFLNRAIAIARRNPNCGFPKIAWTGKVAALIQLSRLAEARALVSEGLDYARKHGYLGYEVDMLAQSAQLAVTEKQIPDAIRKYELAADLAARIKFNRALAEVSAQLAALYQQIGNLRRAEDFAEQAILAHRELGEIYVLPHHLAIQGGIRAAAGKTEEAERTFETAEGIVRTLFLNSPTLNARRAVIGGMSEVWVGHFSLMARMNKPAKAYLVIEEARGRTAADQLQIRQKPPRRTYAMAAAERRLASVQMRLLDAESPTERQELSEELIEVERQLSPPRGEPIRVWSTSTVPLGQLQRELHPDEAVLEYVLNNPASYCLWATHERSGITQLADRGTIEGLVERYLAVLSSRRMAKDEARALFSALLDPIPVYRQKSNLILVPDGILHRIPFAGLVEKTNAYVVESHSTSFVHSGAVLTLLRRQPLAPPGLLLAVGSVPNQARGPLSALVSKPPGFFFRGLSGLTREGLVPLPSSTDEVKAITEILGGNKGVMLLGDQATETNFKKEAERSFRIMHLAVHGFADKAFPDRAGLVFAPDPKANEDGLLQVREIRQLPLRNTSLVTLAACDTNVGRIEGEEGVSSIVYAFLYAGARSAVSAFWRVEDSATNSMMKAFYGHLAQGERKVDALRNAQIDLLR